MPATALRAAILSLALPISPLAAHAAVTYTAIDLNPTNSAGSHAYAASGTFQVGDAGPGSGYARAYLWNSSAAAFTNLHPAGYTLDSQASSVVNGMSATQQVGAVRSDFYFSSGNAHAYLWTGNAASAVDLHPTGYTSSAATATAGTQTVGQVRGAATSNQFHAALWNGTSNVPVDLNPTITVNTASAPATTSFANAVANGSQAGVVQVGNNLHAFAWQGTAASAVDLNPAGFSQSYGQATTGTQFGGKGISVAGPTHALLWTSASAGSALDLNPANFDSSEIKGMAPGIQVGLGFNLTALRTHAIVWFDSAASAVDLNQFLPAGFQSSQAYGVTPEGYIVGAATNDTTTHAFLWIPSTATVPEPATLSLFGLAALPMLRRWPSRRRRN